MAILENETQNYYRADLDRSFIQHNMVFATLIAYGSEADRQKEKNRETEFQMFDVNCESLLVNLNSSERNEGICRKFAHAKKQIDNMKYVKINSTVSDATIDVEVLEMLTKCGYKIEWIQQPIHILSDKLVNCGMHSNEEFTLRYIYDKLKTKMSLNIKNV